jgi:hypothetical protein
LEKAISIGFRSGEYWGRKGIHAPRARTGFGPGALVNTEVVKDDDVAGRERRRQLDLDVDVEGGAVHGAVDHLQHGQALVAQARDQGFAYPTFHKARRP